MSAAETRSLGAVNDPVVVAQGQGQHQAAAWNASPSHTGSMRAIGTRPEWPTSGALMMGEKLTVPPMPPRLEMEKHRALPVSGL